MESKRALGRRLAGLAGFEAPAPELEQYPSSADLAATLIHLADLQGDLERPVLDLGTGTGILALGAALRAAPRVVGIERDRRAVETAVRNERLLDPPRLVDWVVGDATSLPISTEEVTVVMNPPFGAQDGHEHADRAFLRTVAGIATVSYAIHNAGSWEFVEAFAADNDGRITHAYEATMSLERQFRFHDEDRAEIPVELFRIEWQ
jgi:putative methylase